MLIVHVSTYYYPSLGGLERAVQRLAEAQAKLGHEIHVITSAHRAGKRPKEEQVGNVHIHRIRAWTPHYPDLTIPQETPLELLKSADIVQGWSQNSFFTYNIIRKAKKLGKPVAMYFLGVDYLRDHYNPLIRIFGYKYQTWITRRVAKIVNLALTTNEFERRVLKEKYGIEAIVVPHGVDEVYLKTPNMAERFREKYRIEERIVSYIARIHPTKGLDLLIKAFAEVVKHVPDTVLVVAGKGDEDYLRTCLRIAEKLGIRDRIKYLGYISEEDKIALIDASEVVVLPTKHAGESYPLLLDEVVSRGRPMIVTNVSKALASRAKELGLIVTPLDVRSLTLSIVKTLHSNYTFYKSRKVYTWQEIAQKLLKIYNSVVSYMV